MLCNVIVLRCLCKQNCCWLVLLQTRPYRKLGSCCKCSILWA